jgi:hypothetical protein
MKKRVVLLSLLGAFAATSANAITPDACEALTRGGIYDSTSSFSNRQNFELAQDVVCQSKFNTYQDAQSVQSDAGVNIFDVLSASGGETITDTNYRQIREKFCRSNFGTEAQSAKLIESTRTASATIAQAFVDCVSQAQGFFGYVTPTANRESFGIFVQKRGNNTTFDVTEISATGSDIECKDGDNTLVVSSQRPFRVVGAHTFNCRNLDPQKSLLLVVNTTEGPIGKTGVAGIELPGTSDALSDLLTRVEFLEGQLPAKGTIGFFAVNECPKGWLPDTASFGRVMVSAGQGQNLTLRSVGDTGGEERHTMTQEELFPHTHGLHHGAFPQSGTNDTPAPNLLGGWFPNRDAPTGSTGGGVPFNVMQPFIVRTACIKE